MIKRALLLILLGTLIFFALLTPNLERPGFYIKGDGAYYPAVGRNLARGAGFTESFVWLYAGPPFQGVPHPMLPFRRPLLPLLQAGFVRLLGDHPVHYLIPGALLGVLTVFLTYRIARDLGGGPRTGVLAALFCLGNTELIYAINGSLTESYMVLFIGAALWLTMRGMNSDRPAGWLIAAGLLAGLAYLARNYGLLALPALLWAAAWTKRERGRGSWWLLLWVLLAFAAVNLPWDLRNRIVWPGTSSQAGLFYAQNVTDLYSYNTTFTLEHFLKLGWRHLFLMYLRAFYAKIDVTNSFYTWPVVFLAYFGLFTRLGNRALWPVILYWATDFIVTGATVASTGIGCYGSPLYILPFVAAWAALALRDGVRRLPVRLPVPPRALTLVLAAIIIAHQGGYLVTMHHRYALYHREELALFETAAAWLRAHDAGGEIIMISDAVSFNWETGMRAVRFPTDPELAAVLQCARDYGAPYIISYTTAGPLTPIHLGEATSPDLTEAHSFTNHVLGIHDQVKIYRVNAVPLAAGP